MNKGILTGKMGKFQPINILKTDNTYLNMCLGQIEVPNGGNWPATYEFVAYDDISLQIKDLDNSTTHNFTFEICKQEDRNTRKQYFNKQTNQWVYLSDKDGKPKTPWVMKLKIIGIDLEDKKEIVNDNTNDYFANRYKDEEVVLPDDDNILWG